MPPEPDDWTVRTSTSTLGGSQASVKVIPAPTQSLYGGGVACSAFRMGEPNAVGRQR
jgi:hypothetical protein